MAETLKNQDVKMINWITFPKKEALLKRLIDDKGNPGLILRVADTAAGAAIAKKAKDSGFKMRKSGNMLTMIFERGKPIPVKTTQVAAMIGGEITRIPRDRLMSNEMIINLYTHAPRSTAVKTAAEASPIATIEAILPDPDSIEILGLNMRGEEVIRDKQGRFFRRVLEENGDHQFIHETAGGQPALFLRARKPEDLNGIAAGIIRMARKGTLHQADFDRILNAALEEGPDGKIDIDPNEAREILREQVLRQITSVAIENNNDRKSFHQALRLTANTGYVIARPTENGEDLRPGAALLSLFRRLSHSHHHVDVRGHRDLSVALPRLTSEDASLQVQDFSKISPEGMTDYAVNVLSRRPDEGRTVFILPSDMPEEHFERMRSEIGRNYGFEAVSEIASGVADGVRDGRMFKIFFIGDRRPEPLESLPQAALRSFTVTTNDDLISLEREISRSRNRIREFNRGEASADIEREEDRSENTRQRPYAPLSKIGEPFTMIPRALEGASSKALQRVARDAIEFGGVDAVVANAIGCSVADLGTMLTPEQVDAVAMQRNAAERGRGFLEADQTGVGKGRTMAAMMKAHLRAKPENRCLYLTESAAINVPDVLRDIKAVDGLKDLKVLLLTSGSEFIDVTLDPETGDEIHREMLSPKPKVRRAIYESGVWPAGYDLIITTYSQFNVKEDAPQAVFLRNIMDENTSMIMDEAHNALNPKSNTGRNIRAAHNNMLPEHILFATGTPARNPNGMDLYRPLLPQRESANVTGILNNISSGGEVAQEAFATMIAEDGVMIRRDHDLSATDYQVNLPDDGKILEYQDTMNKFSPIVENMIDVSSQIGEIVGRAQDVQYRQMVNAGMDERQARSSTNALSQYSLSIGGPLANLARIVINAIKVDQVVAAAVAEMNNGRKPLITFHSTNSALLTEVSRDEDGKRLTEEEIAELPEMTLRDQISRIHNNLYKMKIDGEVLDPRENNSIIMRAMRGFVKDCRNANTSALKTLTSSIKLADAIAVIENLDLREAMTKDFNTVLNNALPASPERTMIEAYVALKNAPVISPAEALAAIDIFNDIYMENRDDIEVFNDIQNRDDVERYIEQFNSAETFTERNENVVGLLEIIEGIGLEKGSATKVRKTIKSLEVGLETEGGDRVHYDEINAAFERIKLLIEAIPDLPVSPLDALIEKLEANNIRTGEISGRNLCYREDRIQKRGGKDRKAIVDAFNGGDLECLLYNSAGATGGSYHAGATFADRRPRTLIEFEAPVDTIKYVQGQGRANRYDQVASPKVLSIMTGLTPEMRILQQRNSKLRSLGASVDGNRNHPLLLDDVPDFLNKVGDEATSNVLMSSPALARRLGFPKFSDEDLLQVANADAGADVGGDDGSGVAKSGLDSLANKVLSRSIMLPAHEQDDLIQRIRMEFDVLIEELESRNANPLRPKEFGGTVDIRTTTLFSGQEMEDDDLDTSVFLSPVYMSTGVHDLGEDPISADRLVTLVERAITLHGSEGLKFYADRIIQNLAGLLRPYLPVGHEMDTALNDLARVPGRFSFEHEKLTDLAWVLENLQPGVSIKFPSTTDIEGYKSRTVVDLIPPKDPAYYDLPSAYKIKTICPGDSKMEIIAVSRILQNRMENIWFRPGLSDGFNEAYLRDFSEAAQLRQQMPVQILGGNILQAISTAKEHNLGTISLYRDAQGQVHRGIVVHDHKIDMTTLPVPIGSEIIAAEVATQFARTADNRDLQMMRIWGAMDDKAKGPGLRDLADIIIRLTPTTAKFDLQPLRRSNAEFYLSRPGFYEAMHGKPMPDTIPSRAFRKPGSKHKYLANFRIDRPEGRDRLHRVMSYLKDVPMMTDGPHRTLVNETMEQINRDGPKGLECGDIEEGPVLEDNIHVGEIVDQEEWLDGIDGSDF